MTDEAFSEMLKTGKPNSLGRTIEVVEAILAAPARIDELFDVYGRDDEWARLRASNALKRIEAEDRALVASRVERLLGEVAPLDQPSAQWTFAQLAGRLVEDMSESQRREARAFLRRYLDEADDWIVLNATIETLAVWAADDAELRDWLLPRLERHAQDRRKSVAGRAAKKLAALRR
ncbi:MAG: hypothetical protein AAGF90_08880 [Pseudomonadota bacterium]